jgi:hypothetical protein
MAWKSKLRSPKYSTQRQGLRWTSVLYCTKTRLHLVVTWLQVIIICSVQYDTDRGTVLHQRSTVLPVPDPETLEKTVLIRQKQEQLANQVTPPTGYQSNAIMSSPSTRWGLEYIEARKASPMYRLLQIPLEQLHFPPPPYFPIFTSSHPAILLTRILRLLKLIR